MKGTAIPKPYPTHYVYVVVDADDPEQRPLTQLESRKLARRFVDEQQGKMVAPQPDGTHRVVRLRIRRAKLTIFHS